MPDGMGLVLPTRMAPFVTTRRSSRGRRSCGPVLTWCCRAGSTGRTSRSGRFSGTGSAGRWWTAWPPAARRHLWGPGRRAEPLRGRPAAPRLRARPPEPALREPGPGAGGPGAGAGAGGERGERVERGERGERVGPAWRLPSRDGVRVAGRLRVAVPQPRRRDGQPRRRTGGRRSRRTRGRDPARDERRGSRADGRSHRRHPVRRNAPHTRRRHPGRHRGLVGRPPRRGGACAAAAIRSIPHGSTGVVTLGYRRKPSQAARRPRVPRGGRRPAQLRRLHVHLVEVGGRAPERHDPPARVPPRAIGRAARPAPTTRSWAPSTPTSPARWASREAPLVRNVARWREAMPRYTVGHLGLAWPRRTGNCARSHGPEVILAGARPSAAWGSPHPGPWPGAGRRSGSRPLSRAGAGVADPRRKGDGAVGVATPRVEDSRRGQRRGGGQCCSVVHRVM